jgi:hypothetical protein
MEDRDNTDVNACHRSNSGELLLCADEKGRVKLFNYPCTKKGVRVASAVHARPPRFPWHA